MTLTQLSLAASAAAGGANLLFFVIVISNTWDGQNPFIFLAAVGFLAAMGASFVLLLAGLIARRGKTGRAGLVAAALIGLNVVSLFAVAEFSRWHFDATLKPPPPSES